MGEWYCDGKFSVCRQIFFQRYTIHGKNNSKTILCIFDLLLSKMRATYDRSFTMCSSLEMNHIQFPVTLNLLQSIQLQQLSQMRTLVAVSFICVSTFGKRFHHWACGYRILMVRSLLFIYE